jgi:hypothetical protein
VGLRRDVIALAYRRYAAREITLGELLGTVRQWRPVHTEPDQVVLDDPGAGP